MGSDVDAIDARIVDLLPVVPGRETLIPSRFAPDLELRARPLGHRDR